MELLNITLDDLPVLPVFDEAGNEFSMLPFMVTYNEEEDSLYSLYTTEANPNENMSVKITLTEDKENFEIQMLNPETDKEAMDKMFEDFSIEIDAVMELTEADLNTEEVQ